MFKHETKTRMMAMAVVAMFMLTAFSIALVDNGADADNNNGQTYNIYMRTGDTFSYTAQTNLPTTLSATGTAIANDKLSFNSSTGLLSGSFTTRTTDTPYTATITATWTGVESMSQTATQIINFHVYGRTGAVSGTEYYAFTESDLTTVKDIGEFASSIMLGPSGETVSRVWTIDSQTKDGVTGSFFTLKTGTTTTATTTLQNVAGLTNGTYGVVLKATDSSTAAENVTITDEQTFTVYIYVNTDFTAGDIVFNTYKGDNNPERLSKTVSLSDAITSQVYKLSDDSDASSTLNAAHITHSDNVFTIDPSAFTFDANTTSNQSVTNQTIDMKVTGTLTMGSGAAAATTTVSDTFTITYNVYATLAFISAPTVGNVTPVINTGNTYQALITTQVTNAKRVTYNWGDGQIDEETVNKDGSTFVAASHTYARAGTYQITVTAFNDYGNNSSVVMYNAGNDATLNPAPVHEITIKDGKDTSRTIGKVTVEEGKTFKISSIEIDNDAKDFMTKKKVVALYTTAATDGKFDSTKMWNQANQVFSTSPDVLYADIQDTTATDNFFAEHGWLFIVFAILTIIGLIAIFYFGFQTPQVYIAVAILVVLTILLFVYKDFGGIWDAITGLFTKN